MDSKLVIKEFSPNKPNESLRIDFGLSVEDRKIVEIRVSICGEMFNMPSSGHHHIQSNHQNRSLSPKGTSEKTDTIKFDEETYGPVEDFLKKLNGFSEISIRKKATKSTVVDKHFIVALNNANCTVTLYKTKTLKFDKSKQSDFSEKLKLAVKTQLAS